jgi:hypothetical protein
MFRTNWLKSCLKTLPRSQRSRTHPIQDGKEDQHSRVSDKNIHQAVCNLHDCSWHDGETQEVYQSHTIVNAWICRNSEVVEKVSQPEITLKDDILEDLSQLYAEQVEHDAKQVQHDKEGKNILCSSKFQRDISLMGKEVHRQEHYRKWLL